MAKHAQTSQPASDADRPFLISIFIGLAAATIGTGAIAAMLAWTMTQ
ncbi:hypothetical protein [Taklimakanibacter lacteus]